MLTVITEIYIQRCFEWKSIKSRGKTYQDIPQKAKYFLNLLVLLVHWGRKQTTASFPNLRFRAASPLRYFSLTDNHRIVGVGGSDKVKRWGWGLSLHRSRDLTLKRHRPTWSIFHPLPLAPLLLLPFPDSVTFEHCRAAGRCGTRRRLLPAALHKHSHAAVGAEMHTRGKGSVWTRAARLKTVNLGHFPPQSLLIPVLQTRHLLLMALFLTHRSVRNVSPLGYFSKAPVTINSGFIHFHTFLNSLQSPAQHILRFKAFHPLQLCHLTFDTTISDQDLLKGTLCAGQSTRVVGWGGLQHHELN